MRHRMTKCIKHGTVISQCRCPGKKTVTYVDCPRTCRVDKPQQGK